MKIGITGTDTDVGKTVISAWLCYHLRFAYWKAIQTGSIEGTDRAFIEKIGIDAAIYPETYLYEMPCSPHLAAMLQEEEIELKNLAPPNTKKLIIEGAGGIFVPLNQQEFMIDLIKKWDIPVLLVARSSLGTLNHTLLSIAALKNRNIPILGVILNNYIEQDKALKNKEAIEYYADVPVWYGLPNLSPLIPHSIKKTPLPETLRKVLTHD